VIYLKVCLLVRWAENIGQVIVYPQLSTSLNW
jgi:hypothetical protein